MLEQKRKLTPLEEKKKKRERKELFVSLYFLCNYCEIWLITVSAYCCCAFLVQEFHVSPYLLPLKLYGTELFMIWHQFGIKRPCFMLGCNWHFFSKVTVAWADEDFSSIMGKCWESMSHEAEKCDIITGRQTPAGREASPCWPSASFSARHNAWVNVTGFPSLMWKN